MPSHICVVWRQCNAPELALMQCAPGVQSSTAVRVRARVRVRATGGGPRQTDAHGRSIS